MTDASLVVLNVMRGALPPERRAVLRSLIDYHEEQVRIRRKEEDSRVRVRQELGIEDAVHDPHHYDHHQHWANELRALLALADTTEDSDE
jgi:hypothetical protein